MADIQTFKTLQDKVLAWLDEAGDTDTTLTLVKYALIDAHKQRVGQERWSFMLYPPQTISVVANQQSYALHPEYFRPHYFFNTTESDYVTVYKPEDLSRTENDWTQDHGTALKATIRGAMPVAQQPSTTSSIAVSSTSSADVGAQSVAITGDVGGSLLTETVVCGSTSVNSFSRLLKITKMGTFGGTMTLKDAATNTLLTLLPNEAGRSYRELFLVQIPDETESIEYQFYRQPSLLVNDNDLTDIPPPFEELLVWDTLLAFAAYNQYDAMVVKLWQSKQAQLLLQMQQAYRDDSALEESTSYTDYIPRD